MMISRISTAAIAALVSAPLLAQSTPPAPPAPPAGAAQPMHPGMHAKPHDGARIHREAMFPGVSPEGKKILLDAMRDPNAKPQREELKAARERVATILSADNLDVNALRRAMDQERKLVDDGQKARQDRMIAAYQKLSAADRKAFAADARQMRDRIEKRMIEMHKKKMPTT